MISYRHAESSALELRERAVRSYETGNGSCTDVAEQFAVHRATLIRWVQRARATGSFAAHDKRGGWVSPVDVDVLERLVRDRPDRTTAELTRAYNREAAPAHRVHRSSLLRALQRGGVRVYKKRSRPAEQDRPDVQTKRRRFRRWARLIDPCRLVFLDESGAHLAMGRSHAWLPRGATLVEPRP